MGIRDYDGIGMKMKKLMNGLVAVATCMLWGQTALGAAEGDAPKPGVADDGTIHIPAFAIPLSRYMSEEAKRKLIEAARAPTAESEENRTVSEMRADVDAYYRPIVERARSQYPVLVENRQIGGIATQVVTPKSGVAASNESRVLINVHGGGFIVGAGLGGLAEAIPVAAGGKIKVVTVDYRMAPEYHFPAANQDLAAVYVDLLKRYNPENVGIYGCSAGGILSAMAVAWFQREKLPMPGAIGIFGAGAYASFSGPPSDPNTWGGDSSFFAPLLVGQPPPPADGRWPGAVVGAMDYTSNIDKQDALASPALSLDILRKFPPTLLLTGTRALDMSAAVQTHRLLTKAGAQADLHLWDGMKHCFFLDVDLPESQEAYSVITRFFDTNLGRGSKKK